MPKPTISYAQRFEDLHLMRCFGGRHTGFYIDIGSGHPVYDNASFAFYLEGWRGVTVEPNPSLARLSRAVRPRDHHVEALLGAAVGEATFYLVKDFHGLSTMIETHARAAQTQFGKSSQAIEMPVTTLKELCRRHAPPVFEFLKVDVEGAEQEVLLNGDWQSFRPKVVVAEALAPYTLAPAWPTWEPFLAKQGYHYVSFDSLNRYYLAEEASEFARCFEGAPVCFEEAFQFRNVKPALVDANHPDHQLAKLLAGNDMARLPLLGRDVLLECITSDIAPAALDQPAGMDVIAGAIERLFGPDTGLSRNDLRLPAVPCLREVYAALVDTDRFHTACGRISASYAW
ncbi:MAG TPA: FkbM family methyltransferase [Xanthobacteraceae bacterium]|jgi:FkbM family methyltransferase|nr:FkbM family methyltransferase [Xanthobacteraceae bacterium]